MITCGSLFAGIGGFELGAQYAFDAAGINHRVLWQVEQDKFCQSILQKHWPHARIFDDVREVGAHNLDPVDVLMGGFPCQDISIQGNTRGINGEKSGLWWEMWRIISDLRPKIIVLENVANVLRLGGSDVVGSLAKVGYDSEWCIVSAKSQGAPHKRARWFCVAYPSSNALSFRGSTKEDPTRKGNRDQILKAVGKCIVRNDTEQGGSYRSKDPAELPFCNMDDGLPDKLVRSRLKALGNAIVPQCSQYIFAQIINSGLLS